MSLKLSRGAGVCATLLLATALLTLGGCSKPESVRAGAPSIPTVGVTTVVRKPVARQLTVSSELVPYQETDVFAKESGYVTDLRVDYGTCVKKGNVMAVLEIPELEIAAQTGSGRHRQR